MKYWKNVSYLQPVFGRTTDEANGNGHWPIASTNW